MFYVLYFSNWSKIIFFVNFEMKIFEGANSSTPPLNLVALMMTSSKLTSCIHYLISLYHEYPVYYFFFVFTLLKTYDLNEWLLYCRDA